MSRKLTVMLGAALVLGSVSACLAAPEALQISPTTYESAAEKSPEADKVSFLSDVAARYSPLLHFSSPWPGERRDRVSAAVRTDGPPVGTIVCFGQVPANVILGAHEPLPDEEKCS
jgi:hypothetical protein